MTDAVIDKQDMTDELTESPILDQRGAGIGVGGFSSRKPAPVLDEQGRIVDPATGKPAESRWKRIASEVTGGVPIETLGESDAGGTRFDVFRGGGLTQMGRDGEGAARSIAAQSVVAGFTDMDALMWVQEAPYTAIDRLVEQLILRRRGPDDLINMVKAAGARLGMDRIDPSLNRFGAGLQWSESLPEPGPLPIVWPFGIYERALHQVNGMRKSGKSSIMYNIVTHLVAGKSLWGVDVLRQEKILYLDAENQAARPHRLRRISKYMDVPLIPERLAFHDGDAINLSDQRTMKELGDLLLDGGFTGLVIDPFIDLFETANENDNAEAGRQSKSLRTLINRTGAWVVVVHHMGSNGTGGRGATSREGSARVVHDIMTPEEIKEENDDFGTGSRRLKSDMIRFHRRLDGIGGDRDSLYLQMLGGENPDWQDCFERKTYNDWMGYIKAAGPKGETVNDKAARAIRDYFEHRDDVVTRKSLIEHFKAAGFGQPAIDGGLDLLSRENADGSEPFLKKDTLKGNKGTAPIIFWRHGADITATKDTATGSSVADDLSHTTEMSATKQGVVTTETQPGGIVKTTTEPQPQTQQLAIGEDDVDGDAPEVDEGDDRIMEQDYTDYES